MSNEKKPWLFRLYRGWNSKSYPVILGDCNQNHFWDPGIKTTRMTTLESRLRVSPSWLIITSQDFFTSGRERWHLGTLPGKGRFWNGWIAGCSGDLSKCDSYFIVKRWNMMWKVDECQKIWWKWMGNGWTNKRFLLFSFVFFVRSVYSPFSASGPNQKTAHAIFEKKNDRLKRVRDEVPRAHPKLFGKHLESPYKLKVL